MAQPSTAVLSAIVEGGFGILQSKYTYLATYVIIIYEHLTTMDLEVEHIWKRKFSVVTGLFFMTRYYFLFAYSIELFLFVIPVWGTSRCDRALLFVPLGFGVPLTFLPNCIIALRIYALYGRNNKLALAICVYLAAHLGVGLWVNLTPSLTRIDVFAALGYPELDNVPTMHFCAAQQSAKLTGVQRSAYQITQSIFDTVALALILINARINGGSGLITLIAKQGLAYYIMNVPTYVTWTLMLIFAPAEFKYVMAGPALALACVSVNRHTLHLRSYIVGSPTISGHIESTIAPFNSPGRLRQNSWLGVSTFEMHDTTSSDDLNCNDCSVDVRISMQAKV